MLLWEQLFAHRHWITINALGREFHFCARCSGTILGFLSSRMFLPLILFWMNYPLSLPMAISLSLILALPSIIDWITQSFELRNSNNSLRLKVGFLEGVGVGLLGLTDASISLKLTVITGFGLCVIFIGLFGRRRTGMI